MNVDIKELSPFALLNLRYNGLSLSHQGHASQLKVTPISQSELHSGGSHFMLTSVWCFFRAGSYVQWIFKGHDHDQCQPLSAYSEGLQGEKMKKDGQKGTGNWRTEN